MDASTLLGAVAVGLQLWTEDRGVVALRCANEAAPAAAAGVARYDADADALQAAAGAGAPPAAADRAVSARRR